MKELIWNLYLLHKEEGLDHIIIMKMLVQEYKFPRGMSGAYILDLARQLGWTS